MSDISDEMLMAYADGELDAVERQRVADYLRSSQTAADRLEVFAATGRTLADVFDPVVREPVPQRLVDTVRAVPGRLNVIRLDQRAVPSAIRRERGGLMAGAALAASIAVAVVAGGTNFWPGVPAPSGDEVFGLARTAGGQLTVERSVAQVLDRVASETKASQRIAGVDATITPIFSFIAKDQAFCRQYLIERGASAQGIAGVACRDAAGGWSVKVHVATAVDHAKAGKIITAGKGGNARVDALVDQLISGDVLGETDEASVISNGWKMRTP